jgi:hypothetical protein
MISNARRYRLAPRAALLLAVGAVLSACGSMFSSLPEKAGGLPAGAPERPAETLPYQNIYEPRPVREAKPLTDSEQQKLGSELATLRDHQNMRANPPPPPPKPKVEAKQKKAPAKAAKATAPARKEPGTPIRLN